MLQMADLLWQDVTLDQAGKKTKIDALNIG
jgi:hypothetical protein